MGDRLFLTVGDGKRLQTLALDRLTGRELWRRAIEVPRLEDVHHSLGSPASATPVTDGERLYAYQRRTGAVAWRVERPEMRRGFGMPIVWSHDGRTDLVVPGTIWLKGLDPATGAERWRVSGLARITATSPALGDGMLLAASWTTGGDRFADRITMPAFDGFVKEHDRNGDGRSWRRTAGSMRRRSRGS